MRERSFREISPVLSCEKEIPFISRPENDKTYDIKASDVVDMNVNHYIFMSDSYYHKVFDKTATNNTVLVHLKMDQQKIFPKQATKLLAMDDVLAVTQNSSLINQGNTAVRGLKCFSDDACCHLCSFGCCHFI